MKLLSKKNKSINKLSEQVIKFVENNYPDVAILNNYPDVAILNDFPKSDSELNKIIDVKLSSSLKKKIC
uniref:Uncharacterized protein n=1 Tax=Borely moumouvirus TaxID=2712067 RepID=A0A6G6ADZ4_9VIRU